MSERPSYRKINYAIRPAKNIQRKMIAEICACLRPFRRINSYRYIGFGSTFFSDFILFHRRFGFNNMISIEKEVADKDRFEFNKPLGGIRMHYGESSDIISRLEWRDIPTIVWLDYDTQIDVAKIEDIEYIVANVCAGSLIIITLRAVSRDISDSPNTTKRFAKLNERLASKLPHDINPIDTTESRFPKTLRRIINENVLRVLAERNAALSPENHLQFRQLMFFVYDDGTRMATIGGLIVEQGQSPIFDNCDFRSLEFYNEGDTPYEIRAPNLTFYEQRYLDSQIPDGSLTLPGVPAEDVSDYVKVYRHFPKFVEAEL